MADEAIEAPADETSESEVQDTPSPEGTPDDSSAPEESSEAIDWQKRYEDLRPQWDRTKQQNAQYEQYLPLIQSLQNDPQGTIRALQEEYGAETDDDDEFEDPGERALRILQEQQETAQQTAERERREQFDEQFVDEGIAELTKRDNSKLSDTAEAVVHALATHPALRGEGGAPGVEDAYKALKTFEKEVRDSYIASKKAPRIPSGRPGERQADLSTTEGRTQEMANIIASYDE